MEFICQRSDLLDAVNIVSKAVNSRTTLPILECILIEANNTGISLTANDLEIAIKTKEIEAEVIEDGSIAINASFFFDIIRKFTGEKVKLSCSDDFKTVLTCDKSKFNIMAQNSESFPKIENFEKENSIKIKSSVFKNMIKQTVFSVAADASNRPVLTGELIETDNNKISMVSVDGYRISYIEEEIENADENSIIVPGKTLNELSKILPSEEDDFVYIFFDDKNILFDISGNILLSRLIDGDFIKYEQSFTNEYKTKIIVNKTELLQALDRASLFAKEIKKIPVKFEISLGLLKISSDSQFGNTEDEIHAETDGDNLKIAFNPRYISEALRAIDEDYVSMYFTTSLSPCIIKGTEKENYKYLVLPLRI